MNLSATSVRNCFRTLFLIALLASVSVITGCQTPAQRLDPGSADFIKPGVTTRNDLVKAFGPPNETVAAENGRTLLFWQLTFWATQNSFSAPFSPDAKNNARGLSALVDQNNVVIDSHYSNHSFSTFVGPGAASIGNKAADEVISQIHINQTTRAQAEALVGEPMMESLNSADELVLDWAYSQGDYISGRTQRKLLRLTVNKAGIVTSVHTVDGR